MLASTSPQISFLLQEFHCGVLGGYSGFIWTYKCLSAGLLWHGVKQDVKEFVNR